MADGEEGSGAEDQFAALQRTEEKVKKALSSPKVPPLLLALGSGIWRLVALWSNVDFILSVREERVAVILEALLDWGWVAIIVVGLIWAFYAPYSDTDKTKVNVGLALAVGALAFMSGTLITTQASAAIPNVLTAWGATTEECGAQVDTSKMAGFKDKYHIVLICGISSARIDPFEDQQIAVSTPFTITGAGTNMNMLNGKMVEAMVPYPPGVGFGVWHSLALLPMSVDVTEIKRPSDVEKRGGIFVTDPKVGGFQQFTGKAMPTTSQTTNTPSTPVPGKNP